VTIDVQEEETTWKVLGMERLECIDSESQAMARIRKQGEDADEKTNGGEEEEEEEEDATKKAEEEQEEKVVGSSPNSR
jgi:hypothetical protein